MKSGIHPSCGGSRWSKWRAAVDRNPLILLMRRFVRRLHAVVRGGCAKILKSLVRRFCGGWGCGSPHTPLRLRALLGRRASVMKLAKDGADGVSRRRTETPDPILPRPVGGPLIRHDTKQSLDYRLFA
jgi:hypothetical protein